jgi:hypothetical protein
VVISPALPTEPVLENTVRWLGIEKFGWFSELKRMKADLDVDSLIH